MGSQGVSLEESWRRAYRASRYCRHLTQVELDQRLRDLFVSNLRLTPAGKVGLPKMDAEGQRGMEIFTHVLEEMALRHGPYPKGFTRNIFHSEPFPDFVGQLGQKAANILCSMGINSDDVFIKFGKEEHMRALFERGAIRVQPATYYATPSHNGAIRDDELSLPISLSLNREEILRVVFNPEDVPDDLLDHRFDITYRAGTDYWLYCVTTAVEPRLFVDFQANACVIIKDKERFAALMEMCGTAKVSNAELRQGKAIYIDPLRPDSPVIEVPMSKHIRYGYQREYRFVWKPPQPAAQLPYMDLQLGCLAEFSELVVV